MANAGARRDLTAVLIDGYALSDGSQLRGVGTYIKRLIAGLGADPRISLHVLADPSGPAPAADRVALRHRSPPRWRNAEHELLLPLVLARRPPDVFLSPAQHPPRRSPVPWVQTLHDVIPLTHPDPLLARDRRRWRRIGPRLRRAAAVIAVSQFSADEGLRHFGLDARRLHVIHQGVDHARFRPAADTGAAEVADPYVLHVAAWGPHKGFAEAIALIGDLAAAGLPHRLVLAGPQDAWMQARIREAVAAGPRPDRVQIAGYVEDLASLYRGATALVMTTRCEGFGLPALEAMACGTPVLAFANSSLPEVVGDGGVLVPDGDVRAMATAVQALVLGGDSARAELARAGIARAREFTWERTTDAHAELLRAVAG